MVLIRNLTITSIGYLSIIFVLILSNGLLFYSFNHDELMTAPHDVDKTEDNHTFICTTTFAEMLNHLDRVDEQEGLEYNNTLHKVIEVDEAGKTLWEIAGLAYPHEVEILPNEHLLIADTGFDRVIEVNYPNTEIIWSWEPSQINWTQINPEWSSDHYYNNEIGYDWSHLNDVDYIDYGTWEACLISLRNFDLIVEVNYTAERLGPVNNPNNIVWWYGNYGDHDLIYKQHNPDYLSNGNIMIADSLNNRVIEITKDTKEIVWEFSNGLMWPRDCDELADGSLLITDSFNNRVIKIEKESKSIVWSFSRNIIIPYEADELTNGNILISGEYAGLIYEVNAKGRIVWQYGKSIEKSVVLLNSTFMIFVSFFGASMTRHKIRTADLKKRKKILNIVLIVLFVIVGILSVVMMTAYSSIITAITRRVYSIIGTSMF